MLQLWTGSASSSLSFSFSLGLLLDVSAKGSVHPPRPAVPTPTVAMPTEVYRCDASTSSITQRSDIAPPWFVSNRTEDLLVFTNVLVGSPGQQLRVRVDSISNSFWLSNSFNAKRSSSLVPVASSTNQQQKSPAWLHPGKVLDGRVVDDVLVMGNHIMRAHFLIVDTQVDGRACLNKNYQYWQGGLGFSWFNASTQQQGQRHQGNLIGRWGSAVGFVPKEVRSQESVDGVAVGYSLLIGLSAFKTAVQPHWLQWASLDSNGHVPAFVEGHYGQRLGELPVAVDATTTFLVAQDKVVHRILELLLPKSLWRMCWFDGSTALAFCDCSVRNILAPLHIWIGTQPALHLLLYPEDLLQSHKSRIRVLPNGHRRCMLKIAAGATNALVLGDMVLKRFATIWDFDRNRIGFAAVVPKRRS